MTWPRLDGLRTLELGSPGPSRRELTDLVLSGAKRATAGLLADHEAEGEDLEHPGERLALVDDAGARISTVEITDVQVVPFAEVGDDFARAEGEGFTGHADWATAHHRFWRGAGLAVEATTAVVCIRFRLVDDG